MWGLTCSKSGGAFVVRRRGLGVLLSPSEVKAGVMRSFLTGEFFALA